MEIPFQIIFSILVISVTISAFIFAFSIYSIESSENKVVESFKNLASKLENLCWSFPFTQEREKIILNENVIAIFSTSDISNLQINEETEGNFICLRIKDKRPICEKLSCNVSMKVITFEKEKAKNVLFGLREYEKYLTLSRSFDKIIIES
ncbi:MAG: hypothetical protein QXQ14_00430 [Candidatus Aenigmatarchaeota archaeon]